MTTQGTFETRRERVETMIFAGEPFDRVEREIDASPLVEDQRAALWLVAWSLNDRPASRVAKPPASVPSER